MGIGGYIGIGEMIVGVFTLNPAVIADGARRTATSVVVGEITAPVKEALGDVYADTDWGNVIDTCTTW